MLKITEFPDYKKHLVECVHEILYCRRISQHLSVPAAEIGISFTQFNNFMECNAATDILVIMCIFSVHKKCI